MEDATCDDVEYDEIGATEVQIIEREMSATPAGKLVIPISRAGVIAGTVASSAGYTITNALIQATSVTADYTLNGVGYIVEKAAGLVAGPIAEIAVHGMRTVLAGTARQSISAQGPSTALIISAVAGTGACLTVTAGEMITRAALGSMKKIAIAVAEGLKEHATNTITDCDGSSTNQTTKDNNSAGHGDDRTT